MKRRNAELGKMRRPMKKGKIAEGICGSFFSSGSIALSLFAWMFVMLVEHYYFCRLEYTWSVVFFTKSLIDSYRLQGFAFAMFFVCVALTSDMLAFFFIPMNWMFFLASVYVWIQFVWYHDRAMGLPTIVLFLIAIYVEVTVRFRDFKHNEWTEWCKPLAAHSVGYPVVSLGFGVKSYVGYRMRQRKQRDVAKENEFYMQLMQQALPPELKAEPPAEPPVNALVPATTPPVPVQTKIQNSAKHHEKNGHIPNGTVANGVHHHTNKSHHHRKSVDKCKDHQINHHHSHTNGSAVGAGAHETIPEQEPRPNRRRERKEQEKEREAAEYLQRLESDVKKLRSELQSSRSSEQELRLQVATLTTSEKVSKGDICSLQRDMDELQQRLQSALSTKSSDKQSISNLERRLAEERRIRSSLESQLNQERKSRKQEEARAAQVAAAQSSRGECTDSCKARRRDLENELADCRAAKRWADERINSAERENALLNEQLRDTEILMSALSAMQEKNSHLENSLSAENRIKLDLFSALGEAKRQLEIREHSNRAQEKEIEELKSKIAQVLAVMPNDTFGSPTSSSNISRVRLTETAPGSTLDPNATAYTPKSSLVASTEA